MYAYSFWNVVLILLKETPQKNAHKTLPSFATRFTTTGGGLRPDYRLYALGVVSCKNHTSQEQFE